MRQLFFLLILVIYSSILPTDALGETHEHQKRFNKASSQFMCQCGCGQSVSACSMESCGVNDAFKKDLTEKINNNMSIEEIKDYYVDMYGESILASPLKKGFSLTVWLTPFIVIISGIVGFIIFMRRKQNKEMSNLPNVDVNLIDETTYKIINDERKKFL